MQRLHTHKQQAKSSTILSPNGTLYNKTVETSMLAEVYHTKYRCNIDVSTVLLYKVIFLSSLALLATCNLPHHSRA